MASASAWPRSLTDLRVGLGLGDDPGALTFGNGLQLVPLRLGLDSRSPPVPLRNQLELVSFGLGGAPDRGVQLTLPPGDFLHLNLDLLLPLDNLHLQLFLADPLASLGLLQ